jgi:hypothetical protein
MHISIFSNHAFEQAKLYLDIFALPLRRMNTKPGTRSQSASFTTCPLPIAAKAMLLTMPPDMVFCLRPLCLPGRLLPLPESYSAATPLPLAKIECSKQLDVLILNILKSHARQGIAPRPLNSEDIKSALVKSSHES